LEANRKSECPRFWSLPTNQVRIVVILLPAIEEGVRRAQPANWQASDQSLLSATMMATPAQRLAWLEEALRLAYATGALKPRRFLSKEEWDAMGASNP